jgi:hypothetical protein
MCLFLCPLMVGLLRVSEWYLSNTPTLKFDIYLGFWMILRFTLFNSTGDE